jgi:hypothetical protein
MKARPFKSLAAVSAAAAAVPMTGGTAKAVEPTPKADPARAFAAAHAWTPKWYFSAEGGALFSDYSRTSFPGGLDPAFGKMGDFRDSSGSLSPGHNRGWFGALSIGRDIDPIWDWRLTGSFNTFNRNSRNASVNVSEEDGEVLFDSSRRVTESDRFRFGTIDFDMGRKAKQGMLETRTFYGVRFLGAEQNYNISDAEAKGFFVPGPDEQFIAFGSNASTQTRAHSHLWVFGPRVGIEGFYGDTFGITGSASAAFLVGWRSSHFEQKRRGEDFISFCIIGPGCDTLSDPFSRSADIDRTKFTGVGDLAASLGLGFRPSETVRFEAGYKLQWLWNAADSFNWANDKAFSGNIDQKKNILIHSPFVKASIIF